MNGCFSETQANAIARHIGYVIGMNNAIGDSAASAFGWRSKWRWTPASARDAFRFGCIQIALRGFDEEMTPVITEGVPGQTPPHDPPLTPKNVID